MIVGLGLDVVELDRISRALDRYGERFLDRILTEAERSALPKNPVPYISARFAAKEAGVKALGTGFRHGITLHDLEVFSLDSGKPCLRLMNFALKHSLGLGVTDIHLSITHGRDIASAVVVLENRS
ncbi:MAG TPA: holo-[acyl-carrier-protein] synthase [Desulfomicrobiaceae bacterium]|nr:holo-[acyl-carrier-protein] synthase [Desulfomicrobiaceae bacterium]